MKSNDNDPCRGGIYHGPLHAADVLEAAGVLLDELHPMEGGGGGGGGAGSGVGAAGAGAGGPRLSDLQALALVLGAAMHDVYHPGVTNAFRVAQWDDTASRRGFR